MTALSKGLADFTAQILSIFTTGNSLKPYYDRNAINASLGVEVDIGGTAANTRWSYTVPANRKASVKSMSAVLVRTAAASVVGNPSISITDNISLYVLVVQLLTNNVGDKDELTSNGYDMIAGNILKCTTIDSSTGGHVTAIGSATIMEFDA